LPDRFGRAKRGNVRIHWLAANPIATIERLADALDVSANVLLKNQ